MGYFSELHAEGPYRTWGEAEEARRWYPDEYRMAVAGPPVPPSGDDPTAPADPDPAPGRCPSCNDHGPCWECGALDLSALGRKLRHEMRDDRGALLRRLRSTPRRFWRVLAHAYALEIGQTPACTAQPTEPGILWLWATLEREAAGPVRLPPHPHPLLVEADASAESYMGMMTARTERE